MLLSAIFEILKRDNSKAWVKVAIQYDPFKANIVGYNISLYT